MMYFSTRDPRRLRPASLKEAAFDGLAPDGGLFMPGRYPQADLSEMERLSASSYADMAVYLAGLIFGDDVPEAELKAIVSAAYDFDAPLYEVGGGLRTLQLFKGPTFAFKDFGARFMGRMTGWLNRGGDPVTVLTATSGDTGSAVAQGFWKVPGVKVVVLFPDGKVSDFQEAQMTTLGVNIFPLRVKGAFDDCQRLVKEMFADRDLRSRVRITSANSINILRWIPQSFYYFYAWAQWKKATGGDAPVIVVPSGNYGNITAGMLAWRMGLPVRHFVAAANANDVVPRFLSGDSYSPVPSVETVANAMDVGAPSNFERMMQLFDGDEDAVRAMVTGYSWTDAQIRDGIAELHRLYAYVSDPHSATGWLSWKAFSAPRCLGPSDGFWLSTAHAAKFAPVIGDSLGFLPELPEEFRRIASLPRHSESLDASAGALKDYLLRM